mgnify:CR=1 FL=1
MVLASLTLPPELNEMRTASAAGGGTELSTTEVFIGLPLFCNWIHLDPRNFATGVVAEIHRNPWIVCLRTQDALLRAPLDISEEMQDGDTTIQAMGAFDTLANGDFLLIGSHLPFRGVRVDVGTNANAIASVLTAAYWDLGSGVGTWTSLSATDGTAAAGASLAVDGAVTWTVPGISRWRSTSLKDIYPTESAAWRANSFYDFPMYWTRWVWDAALSTTVDLLQLLAIERSAVGMEIISGRTVEMYTKHGPGALGNISALMNAGTGNLIVNVATLGGGRFKD